MSEQSLSVSQADQSQRDLASYVLVALVLLFSSVAIGWMEYRPAAEDQPVLALFADERAAERAEASILAEGGRVYYTTVIPYGMAYGLVAKSAVPGFHNRLHKDGAMLLLKARQENGCIG